jgi:hypothetical protein
MNAIMDSMECSISAQRPAALEELGGYIITGASPVPILINASPAFGLAEVRSLSLVPRENADNSAPSGSGGSARQVESARSEDGAAPPGATVHYTVKVSATGATVCLSANYLHAFMVGVDYEVTLGRCASRFEVISRKDFPQEREREI